MHQARQEAFSEGFELGLEEARKRLNISMDWSPVQELMNRIYTDGHVEPQYVENREDTVLREAAAWDALTNSSAWQSVVRSCNLEINRRVADMLSGSGVVDTHRAVIQLCKGLTALPGRVQSTADQIRAAQAPEE